MAFSIHLLPREGLFVKYCTRL